MAADTFARALALVFELEGGFVQDPRDPGGATNLGITRATLARARGRTVSVADVKALTREEAGRIYRDGYWNAVGADRLPSGLDLCVFDHAVNSGPGQAVRTLQKVLGLAADGRIGPATLAAAATCDVAKTIRALGRERLRVLEQLATWSAFRRGWARRVARVEREALALVQSSPSAPATARLVSPITQEEHVMTNTKSVFASRTVWSNLIGLASLGLGLAGVQTGQVDANGLADALSQIVAGGSFVASTIFRLQATKQIGAPGA